MRSKQEIFDDCYYKQPFFKKKDTANKAMDEYAKEVAIEFIKWAVDNYSVSYEGFGLPVFPPPDYNKHDAAQLFELFKKENNIQ